MLLTNDDGYDAPGIRALFDALARHHNVIVAAPRREQSGMGHAFTFAHPLYYEPFGNGAGPRGYAIDGTPSDCVKFAISHLLPAQPQCVVAGMNLGENTGTSGYYSGTVAAAREGAFWGIPSFAVSACAGGEEHLESNCRRAAGLIERLLEMHPRANAAGHSQIFFNINFPSCSPSQMRGVRFTRQSLAFFDDRYRAGTGEDGREGYWIYGEKRDVEPSDEFDSRAIVNGFIAITPLSFDATARGALDNLMIHESSFNGARSGTDA
jgi:5'-nucleotidase